MNQPNYEKGGVFYERAVNYPPARFVSRPKENKVKSREEGRPFFEDKPYVEILKEGGKILQFEVSDRPDDQYKARYPREWDAFQNSQELTPDGTKLELWPGCTRAEAENLKGINIFTVEQLSEATDAAVEKIMGGRGLQSRAREYLDASMDAGKISRQLAKFREQNEYLTTENEELREMVSDLNAQVEALAVKEK